MERGHPSANIVLVLDNAPVHCSVESVLSQPVCAGAQALRLAPYSPMLNPIEHIWSTVKSRVKSYMRENVGALQAGDGSGVLTVSEFRLRFLEQAADRAMAQVTSDMCRNSYRHVQQMFPRALDLPNMLQFM